MSSMSKYLLVGGGLAVLGAGLFYLSQDSTDSQYNPKNHTKETLYNLLEDLYLEYACSYVFYYNMILNLKEQNQLSAVKLENFEQTLKNYTAQKDELVCKKYKINTLILEQWLQALSKDKKVKQVMDDIKELHKQVLVDHQVKSMHFDLPEEFTREKYVQIIRKVLACVRHKAYNKVQKICKKEGKEQVTPDEMEAILLKITEKNQEEYRIKSLGLFKIPIPEDEPAKRLMQKAYLYFSTVSGVQKEGEFIRSRWEDQITHEQKVHSDLIHKIQQGERIEGIEKDPLDNSQNEYQMDYSNIPGFMQRENSIAGGDVKLRIQPHDGSLKKVAEFMHKGKEHAQKRIKDREQNNAIEEAGESNSRRPSQQDEELKEKEDNQELSQSEQQKQIKAEDDQIDSKFSLSDQNKDEQLAESQEVNESQGATN